MFRRFLLIWALLPALCLGLLGQGHGLVLCQEACGCVAVETAHGAKGHGHDHADCGHDHATHAGCACGHAEETDSGCRDTELEAGDHLAPQAVKLPDLTAYPCGAFIVAWSAWSDTAALAVCGLSPQMSGRGPPPDASLPAKMLAALRTVVLLV